MAAHTGRAASCGEVYARPFGAAISEAGMESVMCAYSDVNGEPAAASHHLLTHVLRGVLGFTGFTVADYGAVHALYTRQGTATGTRPTPGSGPRRRLDVELPGATTYPSGVARQLRDGSLDEAVVDHSVRLVLSVKFRLRVVRDPYGDADAFAATNDGTRCVDHDAGPLGLRRARPSCWPTRVASCRSAA